MKKITLLVAAFLFIGTAAFSQVIDRTPDEGGQGLISTKGSDGTGVYSADYFELDEDVVLGDLVFFGFGGSPQSGGDGTIGDYVTGFNVYIFANSDAEMPDGNPENAGNAVLELSDATDYELEEDFPDTGELGSNFTINVTDANGGDQVTLPAGEYWISAFPTVEGGPADAGRWNWLQGEATPANPSLLIDPADLFGAGATDWLPVSDLIGEPFSSFAWQMYDANMGVEDFDAQSFNHYTQNDQLFLDSEAQMSQVSVFNMLGQEVVAQNIDATSATVDLNGLSSGVYLVKVGVQGQTKSFKIVK